MLEYVYRLNLPHWHNVKLPGASLEASLSGDYIKSMNPKKWMLPEFQTIKGFELTHGVILKKLNKHRSSIHVDNNNMEDPTLIWGINWVNGYGGMEYWDSRDQIDHVEMYTDTDNYTRPNITMKHGPTRDYRTIDGGVYLVNASVPHTGYNDIDMPRIAICTRPDCEKYSMAWSEIVAMFSDLIIE
jgi:hypothetical protein